MTPLTATFCSVTTLDRALNYLLKRGTWTKPTENEWLPQKKNSYEAPCFFGAGKPPTFSHEAENDTSKGGCPYFQCRVWAARIIESASHPKKTSSGDR